MNDLALTRPIDKRPPTPATAAGEAPEQQPRERPAQTAQADRSGADAARHARIAVAAYYRAQQRGFCPGNELDDWLAAEAEIEQRGQSDSAA